MKVQDRRYILLIQAVILLILFGVMNPSVHCAPAPQSDSSDSSADSSGNSTEVASNSSGNSTEDDGRPPVGPPPMGPMGGPPGPVGPMRGPPSMGPMGGPPGMGPMGGPPSMGDIGDGGWGMGDMEDLPILGALEGIVEVGPSFKRK